MQNLILSLREAGNAKKWHGAPRVKRTIFCLASLLRSPDCNFAPLYARARARFGGESCL